MTVSWCFLIPVLQRHVGQTDAVGKTEMCQRRIYDTKTSRKIPLDLSNIQDIMNEFTDVSVIMNVQKVDWEHLEKQTKLVINVKIRRTASADFKKLLTTFRKTSEDCCLIWIFSDLDPDPAGITQQTHFCLWWKSHRSYISFRRRLSGRPRSPYGRNKT